MNRYFISYLFCFVLISCVSSTPKSTTVNSDLVTPKTDAQSLIVKKTKTNKQKHLSEHQTKVLSTSVSFEQNAKKDKQITLETIMADADWIGRQPQAPYWSDDSNSIFYQQKQQGLNSKSLWQKTLNEQGNGKQVALAKLHQVSYRNGSTNQAGTKKVYTFEGNVFVKNLQSGKVSQITNTSALESAVMFLTNGNIAYRVENKFFEHNLSTNQIKELASLKMADPVKNQKPNDYLAQEQNRLIAFINKQAQANKEKSQQQNRLKAQNKTLTQTEFYLGKNKRLVHASLSPQGNKMLVSITEQTAYRSASNIMPNYITSTGNIKAEKVRARVAENRPYSEQIYLLDLKTGQKFLLKFDNLAGANEDVLAQVKQENYQKLGLDYQSTEALRDIYVMANVKGIKWSDDGQQVAVMLRARDNKDRWLTTVNLLTNSFELQHRLHDNAWINWSFNDFGWLANKNTLYYLSEESGYAHLYVKSLKGKARQLTNGQFEVSDLTFTRDNKYAIFKANKKHPGIYEIYQLALDSKKITPLTNLGGVNDYVLSPDETKLLITHSNVTRPPELYLQEINNSAEAVQLTHTVSEQFLALPWQAPNVVAIPSSQQKQAIYARVYLPENYDQKKSKNKAIMFTHGAGYLQNAHLGWSSYFREFMFHSLLVQQGYVVIDMDYRASKGYGRDWRTAIYRHMGKAELEDLRDGVNWLVENANVDRQSIATYGGSYGGYLTLMAMFTQTDLFQSGAALRLVSDWAYYNHGYTSNILNTPQDDAIAYQRSSAIYYAQGLEKPLLISAPMVDRNVFFQDSVRLVQRLIELEKSSFETAIYPVEGHGFKQPSSWLDQFRRIYQLFEETL